MDPHQLVEPVAEAPSLRSAIGHELADAARMDAMGLANEAIGEVAPIAILLGVLGVFIPVGLLVLLVSFALLFCLYLVIGPQPGLLGTVIGGTWLIVTGLALFLTFRAILGRIPDRIGRRSVPSTRPPIATDHYVRRYDGVAAEPTLAELDARLGSGPRPTGSAQAISTSSETGSSSTTRPVRTKP